MTRQEKIQELQELWCKIVGSDYHKSRDVTHYISITYSYGGVKYKVEHFAYCGDDIDKEFNTLSAAEDFLIKELIRQINDQLTSYIEAAQRDDTIQSLDFYFDLQKRVNKIKDIIPSDEITGVNWEEKFLELSQEVEKLKFERNYADEVLTKLGIDSKIGDESYGLELSIGARILELSEKL